jgi:hypothetical protein
MFVMLFFPFKKGAKPKGFAVSFEKYALTKELKNLRVHGNPL